MKCYLFSTVRMDIHYTGNVLVSLTSKSIFLLQNLHNVAWSYDIPGIAQL